MPFSDEAFEGDLQWWPEEGTIDLIPGQPSPGLLPAAALAKAAAHLAGNPARALMYGAELGPECLRGEIASSIEESDGYRPKSQSLLITGGTSMALDEICATFSRPGDTVLTGGLTYDLALRIFRDRGLRVERVPGEGAELDLAALLRSLSSPRKRPAFVYVIPTFHNPSGHCASSRWRAEFAAMLAEHQETIVLEDDAYRELFYQEPPPPSVSSHRIARTLRLGTFSKTLGPGLRLSWIEGETQLIQQLSQRGMRLSGGGTNHYAASLVAQLLAEGTYTEHVERMREELALRAGVVVTALRETQESGWSFEAPSGGFFFLVGSSRTRDLVGAFRRAGVRVAPVKRFGADSSGRVRIAISFADGPTLGLAVHRAAECLTG